MDTTFRGRSVDQGQRALLRRRTVLGAVLAAGVAGCTPGQGPRSSGQIGPVRTVVPKESVKLTFAYIDSPDMVRQLTAAFSEKYPQVSFDLQRTQFADYIKSIKLVLSSNRSPDIVQYNGDMKPLFPAGLVADLTSYERAYDWNRIFPSAALGQLRLDKTGKVAGSGSLIGVPAGLSLVGVYYNKRYLQRANVGRIPQTLNEFTEDLHKVHSAGMSALSVGALDYGALHLWGAVMNVAANATRFRSWIEGQPRSTIVNKSAIAATDVYQSWAKSGYFMAGANGVSEADSATDFSKGSTAYLVSGNWLSAQLTKAMGDNVGFFLLPGDAGASPVGTGFSVSYALPSGSKHVDAAAAFLNFLTTATAARIVTAGSYLPSNVRVSPPAQGLVGDLSRANKSVATANGLVPFPDFAAPAMLDALTSGLQDLTGRRVEARPFLQSLQQVWNDYHAS